MKGNNRWSKERWMYLDNVSTMSEKELRKVTAEALKYVRQTAKNVLINVGETRAIRQLLESKHYSLGKEKGTGNDVIRVSVFVDGTRTYKNRDELKMILHTAQMFARSKTKTLTGLTEWAARTRKSLDEHGYKFQDMATDSELDWIYSMIKEVMESFGDMTSPPNIVEALWELIMDNADLTYEEIKEEAKRKIKEGEYDVSDENGEIIWRY